MGKRKKKWKPKKCSRRRIANTQVDYIGTELYLLLLRPYAVQNKRCRILILL